MAQQWTDVYQLSRAWLLLLILSISVVRASNVIYDQIITSEGLCWQSQGSGNQISIQNCSSSINQYWSVLPMPMDGTVRIACADGTCLDVAGLRTSNTNAVGTSACKLDVQTGQDQLFQLVNSSVQSVYSGLCMDLPRTIKHPPGTLLSQYSCNNKANQAFSLPQTTQLGPINLLRGPILTSEGLCWTQGGPSAPLTIQTCVAGNLSQIFWVVPFGTGVTIKSFDFSRCVDVMGFSKSPTATIGMYQCHPTVNSSRNQIFVPSAPADVGSSVSLAALFSGLCLDIPATGTHQPGYQIHQWTCNGGTNQQFTLPTKPNYAFTAVTTMIQTTNAPPMCWAANGSSVKLAICDASAQNQQWIRSYGQFVSNFSGGPLCMDFSSNGNAGGSPQLKTCGSTSDQLLLPQANGSIIAGVAYLCLDVNSGANWTDSNIIQQEPCTNRSQQQFTPTNNQAFLPQVSNQTCVVYNYRSEWRDLTQSQRNAYLNAVQTIRQIPSTAGRRSLFDDLVAIHAIAIDYIHQTPMFFPWHRYFLRVYEMALQTVDPSVTIPYWDWGLDGKNPLSNNILFNPSNNSMGTRGDPLSGTPCLNDGIARSWTLYYGGSCVARNYSDGVVIYDNSVILPLVQSAPTFSKFWIPLEVAHNVVHYYMGGINGELYFIDLSVNDPLFFVHHANVDRYWYMWQQQHPSIAESYVGNASYPPGSNNIQPVSLSDLMPGFDVPVSTSMLSDGGGDFCVRYLPYSGTTNPLSRRHGTASTAPKKDNVEKQVPDLPESWIMQMHMPKTGRRVRNSKENSPQDFTSKTKRMADAVQRVRQAEKTLRSIGSQFATEIARLKETRPEISSSDATAQVLSEWKWIDY